MRYFLLLMLLGFFACETPAPPESRADKLAKSLCTCTAQLLALNKQAESGSDSLAFRAIAEEFERSRACIALLGIRPADSTLLQLALKTHCPVLSEKLDFLPELLHQ